MKPHVVFACNSSIALPAQRIAPILTFVQNPRMTPLPRICALLAILAATVTTALTAAEPLRVMSFNIRLATESDGVNAWSKRTEFFFDTVKAYNPDLVGFQEVLAVQHDAITARMSDYGFAGVAREDGQRKGEWSLIGFRKSRFTALASGDFWLSETPEIPGSKSWDAAHTRICSWVRLRETATGREFLFANTHFDHKGVIARQEASRIISARLPLLAANLPAILTGDLNITEDNPAYAVLTRPTTAGAIRWIDAFRAVYPVRTPEERSSNGFKGGTTGSRIDYVFHTADFKATAADIDRTSRDGRFPSDHYPVTAVLQFYPKAP
jgi:endonuclease/exonuclease/phosphatase family metal-dependent hydrolase